MTESSFKGYDFEKPALAIQEAASGTRETDRQTYEPTQAPRPSPAKVRLEEGRSGGATIHGKSTIASLAPGRTFELTDHPLSELNRAWTVISVSHRWTSAPLVGEGERPYENAFVAIASDAAHRPAAWRSSAAS